mmetsp:Transcript_59027/g.93940  ORF Transcript_59027/g.93940 Transcript_59027/m.93940 type:complete len:231 (-) Transcript_59027:74-766(-)
MQVDLYLRWLLYVELFVLFIVFVPVLSNVKRSVLLSLAPLFSKMQLVFWIFTSFIAFIFVTTVKEVYYSGNALSPSSMDATAKLEMARNERDALMSFITLLLLPVIHFHSNAVVKVYKLEQSLTAMTKQASNVSTQYSAMLAQQSALEKEQKAAKQKVEAAKSKANSKEEKSGTDEDNETVSMLRNELELYRARFDKSEKKCKDLESLLEQTKEQLANYEMMQKAVKKKV